MSARPIAGRYEDISFATEKDGWIATAEGEILHSADGGTTWTVQASGLGHVRSIDFLDKKRGFAGTLDGRLYATSDAGVTWTDITTKLPITAKGFCGITHFGNDVHAVGRYVGGAADYIFSADGGATWRSSDLRHIAEGLVDIAFVSRSVGFIGAMSKSSVANEGSATILKTMDKGRSWRPVYKDDSGRGFVWKLFPVSEKLIFAALQSQDRRYRIAKTRDGGEHWETITVATGQPRGIRVQGIGFLDANTGWIGGYFQGMYATKNGGLTWTEVVMPDAMINRYEKVGKSVFTAGSRGILRYASR